jgi:alpha-mannosidase
MVEVTPPEFVVSAVKTAEDGRGLVVRGYNISSQALTVTVRPWKKFSKASQVNLLETDQASLMPGEQGEVYFQVSAFQVASIKFSG